MGKFLSAITVQPAYFVSQQIVRVVGGVCVCVCVRVCRLECVLHVKCLQNKCGT